MSEEKSSFMQQLDAWTETTVIMPLCDPSRESEFDAAVEEVKKAIRQKVLESYRNGQAAGGVAKSRPSSFRPRRPSTN
jgi:hypothetical protein